MMKPAPAPQRKTVAIKPKPAAVPAKQPAAAQPAPPAAGQQPAVAGQPAAPPAAKAQPVAAPAAKAQPATQPQTPPPATPAAATAQGAKPAAPADRTAPATAAAPKAAPPATPPAASAPTPKPAPAQAAPQPVAAAKPAPGAPPPPAPATASAPSPAPPVAKTAKAQQRGAYTLSGGMFYDPETLWAAERKARKLGYQPQVATVRHPTQMTRLLVGYYGAEEAEAKRREHIVRHPGFFTIKRGDQVALYAGSYRNAEKAGVYAETLRQAGFKIAEETVVVSIPCKELRFGSFASAESARAGAARAEEIGLLAEVKRRGE